MTNALDLTSLRSTVLNGLTLSREFSCGVPKVGPMAVTCTLGCNELILVDQAAESGLAANMGGTGVRVGMVGPWLREV